jgi:hypothetical protein
MRSIFRGGARLGLRRLAPPRKICEGKFFGPRSRGGRTISRCLPSLLYRRKTGEIKVCTRTNSPAFAPFDSPRFHSLLIRELSASFFNFARRRISRVSASPRDQIFATRKFPAYPAIISQIFSAHVTNAPLGDVENPQVCKQTNFFGWRAPTNRNPAPC